MSSTAQLDQFASALIRRIPSFRSDEADEEFGRLALELFALQFDSNPSYQAFCRARRATPKDVNSWQEIPVVPTAGFKEFELSCLASKERTAVFHSSGTSEQRPSRHFHNRKSLQVYEASLRAWFGIYFLGIPWEEDVSAPELTRKLTFVFLTPPASEAPHSSLVHMFETIRREWGSTESMFLGEATAEGSWQLGVPQVVAQLRRIAGFGKPLALLGTAFCFVPLLDYMTEEGIKMELPPGSRVLETGGYKGRSRAIPKAELHSLITERLGVARSHLLSEYGMSELSSQAYEAVIGRSTQADRIFRFPPWARARVVSPENGYEVEDGETGLLRIVDLANVYSTMAIQTEDLAVRRDDGFELIGRAVAAEPRGCSLMATS